MTEKIYTAAVLIIGNEILTGRTQDKNLAWLGEQLNIKGVRLQEARVIADHESEIVNAVNNLRARYDYVFTTGGIGPTHDDITSESIAKAFGVDIVENEEALALLLSYYTKSHLTDNRRKLAETPDHKSLKLIPNPVSGAPGFQIENVFVMAGIPEVMRAMFDQVSSNLQGGAPVLTRTISTSLKESELANLLKAVEESYSDLEIGSYPHYKNGVLGVSIVTRSTDQSVLNEASCQIQHFIDQNKVA